MNNAIRARNESAAELKCLVASAEDDPTGETGADPGLEVARLRVVASGGSLVSVVSRHPLCRRSM